MEMEKNMFANLKRIAIFTIVFSCASAAEAVDVVRLGNLKFAHFGAVSYMKELAPKYDLRIDERVFAKGVDIMPAIIAGEIDISASGADAAIIGRSAGIPIYAVAGFSRGGARIIARPDIGVHSIKDLKGKKVGVTRGGAQELLLLAELEKNGLSWSDRPGKDIELVYLGYSDLNAAIATKQIDAMCQTEPQSTQAIKRKFGVEVIKPYDTALGKSVRALVMTEKMYKEHPDVAYRVVKLFLDATLQFQRNSQLAEKYVRENVFKGQLSSEDYRDAMANAEFTYELTANEIQTMTDMMQRHGMGKVVKPVIATEWVKTELLQKAEQELRTK
ncbi:MAG TPA: ABC transporter substrate-binding protein [Burkholderiaceae bacterium]|jgi:NitT/TauT family transport system substrate-binding protein